MKTGPNQEAGVVGINYRNLAIKPDKNPAKNAQAVIDKAKTIARAINLSDIIRFE